MGRIIKKILRVIAGLLAAAINLAIFGGLAWWVSTEEEVIGYIAAGLFGIMAVLGAIIVFIMIVFDDQTPEHPRLVKKDKNDKSDDKIDPATMAAAMLVANSDQFDTDDGVDYTDGYSDDVSDIDSI